MTDFDQMTNYANYIKDDPFRRGLHFPVVEEALGDLNRKRILDIGCGDGLFARLLAERGASVVGYDRAPRRIAEARTRDDAVTVSRRGKKEGTVAAAPGCSFVSILSDLEWSPS